MSVVSEGRLEHPASSCSLRTVYGDLLSSLIKNNSGSLVLLLTVEHLQHGLDYQRPYFLLVIIAPGVDLRIREY